MENMLEEKKNIIFELIRLITDEILNNAAVLVRAKNYIFLIPDKQTKKDCLTFIKENYVKPLLTYKNFFIHMLKTIDLLFRNINSLLNHRSIICPKDNNIRLMMVYIQINVYQYKLISLRKSNLNLSYITIKSQIDKLI